MTNHLTAPQRCNVALADFIAREAAFREAPVRQAPMPQDDVRNAIDMLTMTAINGFDIRPSIAALKHIYLEREALSAKLYMALAAAECAHCRIAYGFKGNRGDCYMCGDVRALLAEAKR